MLSSFICLDLRDLNNFMLKITIRFARMWVKLLGRQYHNGNPWGKKKKKKVDKQELTTPTTTMSQGKKFLKSLTCLNDSKTLSWAYSNHFQLPDSDIYDITESIWLNLSLKR